MSYHNIPNWILARYQSYCLSNNGCTGIPKYADMKDAQSIYQYVNDKNIPTI